MDPAVPTSEVLELEVHTTLPGLFSTLILLFAKTLQYGVITIVKI